jgi:hypothetical protein
VPILFPTDSTTPDDIESIDSLLLDLSTLRAATDNFAESNKLGEGGFGAVYKVATISKCRHVPFFVANQSTMVECLFTRAGSPFWRP